LIIKILQPLLNISKDIWIITNGSSNPKPGSFSSLVRFRLWMQEILALWGPVGAKVSNLDFELRKEREFQNSSRGVSAEAPTPPSLLPVFLASRD
jgi:hypothetical protein